MKNNTFKLIISFIAFVIVVVSLSFTYAWYTNTTKIGRLDAETKDIAFTYQLNDGDVNITKYDVENLTFFDIDNSEELKFLNDMHTVIKLNIKNYSSDIIDYKISFECSKEEKKQNDIIVSRAYIVGFITTSKSLSIDDDGTNTISTYIHTNEDETNEKYISSFIGSLQKSTGSNTDCEVELYLHLLGVQDIDTASNDFLFNSNGTKVEYSFILSIEATGKTQDPEIQTSVSP
ncbi:MAG: hypothetical protein ACI35S_01695 [Anaeroplasma sp.]